MFSYFSISLAIVGVLLFMCFSSHILGGLKFSDTMDALSRNVFDVSLRDTAEDNTAEHKTLKNGDPCFLQSSDHLGTLLVTSSITENNHLSWSRSMKIALGAKTKLGFISDKIEEVLLILNNGTVLMYGYFFDS